MAYPTSLPTSYIVKKVASAGVKSENLLPFEFGIFDEDTNLTLSAANVASKRRVTIGVGSPNTRQMLQGSKIDRISNQNNADVTFRSQPIAPKAVEIVRAQMFRKDEKTNEYYLGYNGIDICESLKFDCGKTYMFHVNLTGRPVRKVFGNQFNEIIELTTDCCADCGTDCTGSLPCENYIDKLVDAFNNSLWVSRFYTAERVIYCSPELEELTRTDFVEYCLTVCDNGDELALSDVQVQYPTLKVEVKERNAPFTTYRVIKTSGLPSAFTQTAVTLQDCGTCPSGFTATAGGFAYLVTVDDVLYAAASGSTLLQKLTTMANVTVSSATLVATLTDSKIYSIVTATAIASEPDAGFVVTESLGSVLPKCTQTTPTSTAWVSCDTWYKVQRDLCITLKVDDCDADSDGADAGETLARLTTFLASVTDYVASSVEVSTDSSDCLLRYTISQYNNQFLQDGCDTSPAPRFDTFPSFENQSWTVCPCVGWSVDEETGCPVPPTVEDRCCLCGIKFIGKPTTQIVDNFVGYDIDTYLEKDPVELSVTVYRDDRETNYCDTTSPSWLHSQFATFRSLRGDDVIKRIILEREYDAEPWMNQVDKTNILFLQREGIKLGVRTDKFYYAIDVYHNTPMRGNWTASHSAPRECVTLFVSEDDVLVFEALKTFLATAFTEAKLEGY